MKHFRGRVCGAVIAMMGTSMLVVGCAGHGSRPQASEAGVDFPDPARSTVPGGVFIDVDRLRLVAPGMTKQQLYDLLGTPQFNEGVFGVHRWNYVFNLRRPDGGAPMRCQYQVFFDRDMLAQQYVWKPSQCAALVRPAPTQVMPQASAPPPAVMPKQPIRLSADTLFDFNKATLSAAGRVELSKLLNVLHAASELQDIVVTGYTDRIGGEASNMALAHKRAEAVKAYLVGQGINASAIRTQSRGEADPVVECADGSRRKLIACLAPNRRVELSGVARA